MAAVGESLAWAILVAGGLDCVENALLLRQMLVVAASPWAEAAYLCAAIKFIFVGLGLLYFLGCTAYFSVNFLRRRRA
jgi:hypothetical protein